MQPLVFTIIQNLKDILCYFLFLVPPLHSKKTGILYYD